MQFEDGPQLPLTTRRKVMAGAGAAMFAIQLAVAALVAPAVTGEGDANAAAVLGMWAGSVPWSVAAVLLLVRQADLPDVATASMLVTIAPFAAFALTGALAARGSTSEVDVVDALFLGITAGALTAMVVWGVAMAVARLLRLPTTAHLREGPPRI